MDWVQWLALTGGLVAALTFVTGRLDQARSDAAAVYVVVKDYEFDRPDDAKYEVHNDGPLPILGVVALVWEHGARRRRTWRVHTNVQHWGTGASMSAGMFPTVGPKSATEPTQLPKMPGVPSPAEPPRVMVRFVDGRGRTWVRWPDGRLSRFFPTPYRLTALYKALRGGNDHRVDKV